MKTYRLLLATTLFIMMACKQNSSTDNNVVLDSAEEFSAETQILTETTYKIYLAENNVVDGLFYMGVTKQERHDGQTSYSIYTNFMKNYSNTYSLSTINYQEDEIAVILKYIDECQSFNPDGVTDAMQSLRYVGKSNYSFIYTNIQSGFSVQDPNNNRYSWNMSLSEIRNLFAGAKERIETLKKEDAKKKKK